MAEVTDARLEQSLRLLSAEQIKSARLAALCRWYGIESTWMNGTLDLHAMAMRISSLFVPQGPDAVKAIEDVLLGKGKEKR